MRREELELPVSVVYVVNGPGTAAGVVQGKTELVAMAYDAPGGDSQVVTTGFAECLRSFGDRPRLYDDALFSLTLEDKNNLPLPPGFEDLRGMSRILGGEDFSSPPAKTKGDIESARKDLIARVAENGLLNVLLEDDLEAAKLETVYWGIELPAITTTFAMTQSGVPVNKATLETIHRNATVQMENAKRQFDALAGRKVNLRYPPDIAHYLFDELGLPNISRTPNQERSTKKTVLQHLTTMHPTVPLIREFRSHWSIQKSASNLLQRVSHDGRVYSTIENIGTATGRCSYSDPPMQGIDASVRAAIEAPPGYRLFEFDVSQTELRILGHCSQDSKLRDAFYRDDDLHRLTAARILGIPAEDVTESQRQLGKKLNFSVIYGQGAMGLAEALAQPQEYAQRLLDSYFREYPTVATWSRSMQEQAESSLEVRTVYGRRRMLPNLNSNDPGLRADAFRQVVNTICQGTAADLLKLLLIRLNELLPSEVRIILSVHDSVLLEVPEGLVEEIRPLAASALQETTANFSVPFKAKIGVGRTWGDCKVAMSS